MYARNGLERALVKLADPDWGKQPSDELTVGPLAGHPADAGARITFHPADPLASVNNFDRDGTSEVPRNTVHLGRQLRGRGGAQLDRAQRPLAKVNYLPPDMPSILQSHSV